MDGSSPSNLLDKSQYSVDLGRGIVTIKVSDTITGLHTFSVRYKTISDEVIIENRDYSECRVFVKQMHENTYHAELFTATQSSYIITYTTVNLDGETVEHTERTVPTEMYTPSDEVGVDYLDKKYVIVSKTELKINHNTIHTFYIRPVVQKPGKIVLEIPKNRRNYEKWYMEVWNDSFTDENGYTYEVVESKDILAEDNSYIRERTEIPIVISDNTVKLSHNPLIELSLDGSIKSIEIHINNKVATITDMDLNNRLVVLSASISPSDGIIATYKYRSYTTPIRDVSLNPRRYDEDGFFDPLEHYAVYFILPIEDLAVQSKSVFVYKLDRRGNLDNIEIRDNATNLLQTDEFKIWMHQNYGDIVKDAFDLHPYILGICYSEKRYNPSIVDMTDTRSRGGGLSPSIDENLYPLTHELWNMFDIGRWDGELFDTGGIIIVKVPSQVVDNIAARFLNHHKVISFDRSESRIENAKEAARKYIKERIDLRKPIGRETIVEFL
jgi:hypothetical protein